LERGGGDVRVDELQLERADDDQRALGAASLVLHHRVQPQLDVELARLVLRPELPHALPGQLDGPVDARTLTLTVACLPRGFSPGMVLESSKRVPLKESAMAMGA
jgi:hypothetical protein